MLCFRIDLVLMLMSLVCTRLNLSPVHTETFSCVFVLFTVLKGIENNQLIT